MIFALSDLLRYRLWRGHYGSDPGKNIMALGHTGRLPTETLQQLSPGDIILSQRMDSLLSWAIMYFGGYAVDHVAIYTGDGKVTHMTLSGVKVHSVNALARCARVLPFRPFGLDDEDAALEDSPISAGRHSKGAVKEHRHGEASVGADVEGNVLPPHLQLLLGGMEIVLGLRPTSFRWRYYLDVGFTAIAVDLLLWPINYFPMTTTLWAVWLMVLIGMRVKFHFQLRAGQRFQYDSHPGLMMRHMLNQGGHIFPARPVNGRWKIRIWPAMPAPSLLRQRAHQSPSQQSSQGSSASDQ